jgi:hypothetical protein
MTKFFKGTEKRPFTYPTIIETRGNSTNWILWETILIISIVMIGLTIIFNLPGKSPSQQTKNIHSINTSPTPEQQVNFTATFVIYTH